MAKQKLVILPKGFPNQTKPVIIDTLSGTFTTASLAAQLEIEYGLRGGELICKYDRLTNHYLRETSILMISYIKLDEMVDVLIDWESFGRSYNVMIHKDDNLRLAIFSIPFMIAEKKYRFYYNEKLIENVNNKFSEVIDLTQPHHDHYRIVAELYE
jgi:hypothetical protein